MPNTMTLHVTRALTRKSTQENCCIAYSGRHSIGPPSPQQKVSRNGQKWVFSNLYKELGYESIHYFDIFAGFLVQIKELLKIFPSKRQNFPYARRNFWEMANFQRKKLITLSNGQIWVHMQRICNVWVTNTPSIMSKRAHLSVGSSN